MWTGLTGMSDDTATNFLGLLYLHPPSLTRTKFGMLEYTHDIHLMPGFIFISLSCWIEGQKPPNVATFLTPTAPPSIETKLNMDSQLRTFPHPTVSKPYPSSNTSGQCHVHKLYQSKVWGTYIQALLTKNSTFLVVCNVWAPLNFLERTLNSEYALAMLKRFLIRHSFATRRRWQFGEPGPP